MKKKKEKSEENNSNNSIKCNVENCKHNNEEKKECTLDEIEVDCTCDSCDCTSTKETICKSFDCDDKEDKQENTEEEKVGEE